MSKAVKGSSAWWTKSITEFLFRKDGSVSARQYIPYACEVWGEVSLYCTCLSIIFTGGELGNCTQCIFWYPPGVCPPVPPAKGSIWMHDTPPAQSMLGDTLFRTSGWYASWVECNLVAIKNNPFISDRMRTIRIYPDMTICTKAIHGIHNSDIRLRWGEQITYKHSSPSYDLESIVMEN